MSVNSDKTVSPGVGRPVGWGSRGGGAQKASPPATAPCSSRYQTVGSFRSANRHKRLLNAGRWALSPGEMACLKHPYRPLPFRATDASCLSLLPALVALDRQPLRQPTAATGNPAALKIPSKDAIWPILVSDGVRKDRHGARTAL